MTKTVFTLVTDEQYLFRAKKTIIDLRSTGQWTGDIVLILLNIPNINKTFVDFYNLTIKRFPEIEQKYELVKVLQNNSFSDTIDRREITKINQWEKLHVFDTYFLRWERVVFLDAGLRVLDNVHNSILCLDWKNKFLAPSDGGNFVIPNPDKLFGSQITQTKPNLIYQLQLETNVHTILTEQYFLNCIWLYDTNLLNTISKDTLLRGILEYPICKTNEMALMNIYIHFKHKLWTPFPVKTLHHKILFDWCESNNPNSSTWRDYCFLKYPCTITFDDT